MEDAFLQNTLLNLSSHTNPQKCDHECYFLTVREWSGHYWQFLRCFCKKLCCSCTDYISSRAGPVVEVPKGRKGPPSICPIEIFYFFGLEDQQDWPSFCLIYQICKSRKNIYFKINRNGKQNVVLLFIWFVKSIPYCTNICFSKFSPFGRANIACWFEN